MELKRYQKQIIADLSRYLDCLNETRSLPGAYRKFWNDAGVSVGPNGVPAYQNVVPGVPNICAKVPTGGGKTLIACHALRPIFDALPSTKARVVVWLVPSDAILTQTLAALRNPSHPYRQAIDADFGNRVEVYTKDQLLTGQNFNPVSVTEQLSVCVLSYDSFRGRRESLKAKRENSALSAFADVLGKPENPIEDADETAVSGNIECTKNGQIDCTKFRHKVYQKKTESVPVNGSVCYDGNIRQTEGERNEGVQHVQ